jgi:small conductance mechanosensitive channel
MRVCTLLTARRIWMIWLTTMLALAALTISVTAWSQEAGTGPDVPIVTEVESETGDPTAVPEDARESIDAALSRVRKLDDDIRQLEQRLDGVDGLALKVLEVRLARYWSELIGLAHSTTKDVLGLAKSGHDVSSYKETISNVLNSAPAAIFAEIDRVGAKVMLPKVDQSAIEQSAIVADARIATDRLNTLYRALRDNIKLQRAYDLDTAAAEAELNARLEERAAGTSAFLDLSTTDARAARAQLAALPDDTEIAARVALAEHRMSLSSDALKSITSLMKEQGLDTSIYNAQLISTTGAITADIFDISVLRDLFTGWLSSAGNAITDNASDMFISVLLFIVVLLVFLKLANIAQRFITKGLASSRIHLSQLLSRMIISVTRGVIIAIGVLIALSQLGISLGPLLAGLGIAGFVLGFALQDSLSNFASGLMILIYKPFDVGDVVEVGGNVFGTVSQMSLVNTTVLTFDNQTLIVPNNSIWQNVIKNVTAQRTRRVDLVFGIGYSDDIPKAERILTGIVESHEAILADPEPVVRLHELGESSVNFVVRPWVKTEDYWPVYWDITRQVKMKFDAEGISIPFPQRDVHLFAESPMVAATTVDSGDQASYVTQHRREYDTTGNDAQDDD